MAAMIINRRNLVLSVGSAVVNPKMRLQSSSRPETWLELNGRNISIRVSWDFVLSVYRGDRLVWRTSQQTKPEVTVTDGLRAGGIGFDRASVREADQYHTPSRSGYRVKLGGFPEAEIRIDLLLALHHANDDLLIEVAQTGGQDHIRQINHLYRIEKDVSEGGYLVVPHGCGYLLHADTSVALNENDDVGPGNVARSQNIVGFRYTLPLFGIVKSSESCYFIPETFWDCRVDTQHLPTRQSSFDFNWLPSLGELRYPRRLIWCFARNSNYVAMAKAYRRRAQAQGLFRTLAEKAEQIPALKRYVKGVEYRVLWSLGVEERALADIRALRDSELAVNFFFPKWSSLPYRPVDGPFNADGGWQSFLQNNPVPGGWDALRRFATNAKAEGALLKMMINATTQFEGGPSYDLQNAPMSEDGSRPKWPRLSVWFGPQVTQKALDALGSRRLLPDALYFDGYSAHAGMPEDFSPERRLSRKMAIEKQLDCFRETRGRGIMPGAELPRFWSVGECDYFFFNSGWSSDLLATGEPVPLFALVFHECYTACFSGGGYGKYDWPQDRNPRLYELLLAAAPAYNWMLPYSDKNPGTGFTEVPARRTDPKRLRARVQWLKRWAAYNQAVAWSEMISHEFLTSDRTLQQVRFANGVVADFDMARGLCRVKSVAGFSGGWERPHEGSL